MKKHIILLVYAVINISNINAQTFRQLFDELDQTSSIKDAPYSFHSNLKSEIKLYEPNLMQAYLNMYEATSDIKYLNEFVVHSTMDIRLKKLENK